MKMSQATYPAFTLIAFLGLGCETTGEYFKVSSYPEGAMVFVDGERRGQTNFGKLEVNFEPEDKVVTLRLEKEGYQTTGMLLTRNSPRQMMFFLEEAPRNLEILKVLKDMLQVLDRISNDLRQSTEGKKQ